MTRIRPLVAAAALVVAGTVVVGTSVAAEEVRIGIAAEPYPPFSSPDAAGNWVGWEIEIIEAVCAAAEMDCVITPIAWDGIIPSLTGGQIDAIMNSMSITEERLQTIDFSDPYYITPTVIVGDRSLEMDATPEGLEGRIIGVQAATIHQSYAQKYFEPVAAEIRVYQTQDEVNQDLAAGRIDALQADSTAMEEWLASDAGACCEIKGTVADDPEILGLGVGIGLRKGEEELKARFNEAIAAIVADGTYDAITERYFDIDMFPG
jgi:polar amino acid transport system substrate-binding protein